MSRSALVISCENFTAFPTIDGLGATALGDALEASLCSTGGVVTRIRNPIKRDFLRATEEFFASLNPCDEFVFALAGRAEFTRSGWVFLCQDTHAACLALSTATLDEVQGLIHESRCHRGTLLFDLCGAIPKAGLGSPGFGRAALPGRSEGLAYAWALSAPPAEVPSGTPSITRASFFSHLATALQSGAGVAPSGSEIHPAEAVRAASASLTAAGLPAESLPVYRESGDTSGLSLGVSPRHDPDVASAATTGRAANLADLWRIRADAGTRGRLAALVELGQRVAQSPDSLQARRSTRGSPVGSYVQYDPVTMGEVCLLPVSRGKLVGVVLSQARSFQVLLTSLGLLYLWTDSFTSSWWQTVAGTVSTLVLVVFATEYAEEVVKELGRCWRNPQRFFLLVTEDGFFEQSEGGQFAMVWEGIESVRYTSKNYESHIYLDTRTTAVPRFTEGTFRNRDICGFSSLVCFGLMEVEAALDWGRSYAADRWNWSILDGGRATDPLSCMAQPRPHLVLVGISAYKHFEQMPGAADVALVRSLFPRGGDGTPVELADPTLDEFEAQLALAFAAGRHGTIVLYFSGHGMKSSSGDLYLCLPQTDPGRRAATAFPVFKLLALKAEMKVAALVLILDCCYSGAGADGLRLSLDEMDPTMSVLWDSERAGLTILAAGGREQVTFAGDTSTFTRELVSEGKRLLDSQGVVRVGDLFRATARRMETVGLPGRVRLFSGEPGSQCVLCNVMAHLQSQRAASQQRIEQNREFLKREAHAVLNRLHSAKGVLGPGIYATPSGGQLVRTAYSPGIQGFVLLRRIAWIVCIAILATSFASDDFSLIEATVMCFGVVVLAGMLSVMLEVDRAAPLFLLVTPLGVVLQTRLERIVYAAEEIRDVRYHKRETPPVYNSYNTSPVTLISVTLVVEGGHAKDLLSDAYKWPLSVDKLFKLLRKAVADYRLVNGEVSCSQKV